MSLGTCKFCGKKLQLIGVEQILEPHSNKNNEHCKGSFDFSKERKKQRDWLTHENLAEKLDDWVDSNFFIFSLVMLPLIFVVGMTIYAFARLIELAFDYKAPYTPLVLIPLAIIACAGYLMIMTVMKTLHKDLWQGLVGIALLLFWLAWLGFIACSNIIG